MTHIHLFSANHAPASELPPVMTVTLLLFALVESRLASESAFESASASASASAVPLKLKRSPLVGEAAGLVPEADVFDSPASVCFRDLVSGGGDSSSSFSPFSFGGASADLQRIYPVVNAREKAPARPLLTWFA
jgi:hypothetical protein